MLGPSDALPRSISRTAHLADRLGREIRSGRIRPGERLPTEQELIARFQVSRTVVREAIASLRAEGLVVSRQGAGVFVTQNDSGRPFRIISDELRSLVEIENVLQLRLAVEVEAAGIAAEHRTKADLELMASCLQQLDAAIACGETAIEQDLAFHCAISTATGNPYFERFLFFLGPIIIPRQTIRLGLESEEDRRAYLDEVQVEHRQIHDAVAKRDAPRARHCLRVHLEAARDRYRTLIGETAS